MAIFERNQNVSPTVHIFGQVGMLYYECGIYGFTALMDFRLDHLIISFFSFRKLQRLPVPARTVWLWHQYRSLLWRSVEMPDRKHSKQLSILLVVRNPSGSPLLQTKVLRSFAAGCSWTARSREKEMRSVQLLARSIRIIRATSRLNHVKWNTETV